MLVVINAVVLVKAIAKVLVKVIVMEAVRIVAKRGVGVNHFDASAANNSIIDRRWKFEC